MAWRLSRYQTFVSNTTVITAAFLNAVQDAILDLFNGNYTVKKFQADGTGDAAVDGTLAAGDIMAKCFRADGGADDEAAIKTQAVAGADWKLLWQIRLNILQYARLYSADGVFIITINAVWSLSSAKWEQEDGTVPSMCLMMYSGADVRLGWKPLGSAAWSSFSWDSIGNSLLLGFAKLNNVISSSTVGAGQAVPAGYQYKDTTPVAWAYVDSDGTLLRGANIATCAETAPGSGVYTITLQNAPANYAAGCGSLGDSTANGGKINVIVNNGGPGNIEVQTYNAAGTAASQHFSLIVFGG